MAYLTATAAGEPLYLNRLLCDADVVIPIASVRMGSRGAKTSDGLYPVFSTPKPSQPARDKRGRRMRPQPAQEAERPDVCWLLGVPCLIQVIPGPGESVLAVLAGEPAAVRRESRRLCEQAWQHKVPHPASLVVAAIEGGASQQTWEQVARALAAATQAVEEEGAIAICCELQREPGPALQALAETDDRDAALKAIRRAQLPDEQIAARLVKACNRATVYLLSDLDEELVEELGMAPISEAAEVTRLANRHESCLLLANAQHAVAIPE
jgi:nickel-dependent lactate racemase